MRSLSSDTPSRGCIARPRLSLLGIIRFLPQLQNPRLLLQLFHVNLPFSYLRLFPVTLRAQIRPRDHLRTRPLAALRRRARSARLIHHRSRLFLVAFLAQTLRIVLLRSVPTSGCFRGAARRANLIAQFHQLLVITPLTNHLPDVLFHLTLEPLVRILRLTRKTGIFLPAFQRRQRFGLLLFRQRISSVCFFVFVVFVFRVVSDDLIFDRFQRVQLFLFFFRRRRHHHSVSQ
mmetsp:Transcript_544/g.1949  ORF Transcript_544/g.1949 Transcript_544/m.1949 type:complete len:232 (-) Transcript_544:284-979(-)